MKTVNIKIWYEGNLRFCIERTNTNPEDEKSFFLKELSFFSKLINPYMVVHIDSTNKQCILNKRKIKIIECLWAEEDETVGN